MSGRKYCDLVMKGGVTSGIVYPPAICELAGTFSFRNIGGTSVGAVAAALAAAAEFGRRNDRTGTFSRLSKIPAELSEPGTIERLMGPDAHARAAFDPLKAALFEGQPIGRATVRGVLRAIRHFGLKSAFFASAVLLVAAAIRAGGGASGWGFWTFAGLLTAGVFAASVGYLYVRAVLAVFHNNRFGFLSGHRAKRDEDERFIDWLERQLQDLSGLPANEPITFQHLARARVAPDETIGDEDVINLQFISTNLTHSAAYRIPFEKRDDEGRYRAFYYDPDEWRDLFSGDVLHALEANAPSAAPEVVNHANRPLRPLPEHRNLPVIVGVRLSLAVPLLFTAVPLYTYSEHSDREVRSAASGLPVAEKCWFVDGGLCANFPIHLFDSPIPRWPTFGINLTSPLPGSTTEADMVWLPIDDSAPFPITRNEYEATTPLGTLKWFLEAVLMTATGWRDGLQTTMPGFRDRVVHIAQGPNEGGFNLGMERKIVEKLACRGGYAGKQLRGLFNWDKHVWIRLRSHLAAQQDTAMTFSRRLRVLDDISPAAAAAITQPPQPPPNYPFPDEPEKLDAALKAVNELGTTFEKLEQSPNALREGSPKPMSALRISPDA